MNNATSIDIGRYITSSASKGAGLRFFCDAPELARHVEQPWFRAYAAERLDLPHAAMTGTGGPAGTARIGHDLLARHACVCGATGSGKTRLALHLLAEQLRAGCSVVMLDPKIETIRHLLTLAYAAGITPEQVTVLSPHLSGAGAPGWNPLDVRASGIAPAQAATDVVSVLEKSTSSWGPRMGDLLTNALILIASHGLSLFEVARFLQRDDYREGLLRLPLPSIGTNNKIVLENVAFEEARDYFVNEFALWSKSERAAAVAPVLNKFRELLRTPFLRSLLCARRTTLHLGALWHRPSLVLVHLDASALGDEGVRLLGGLLAHQLLRTAMRAEGPVPVVLALDEMGVSEEFVGGAAAKILAIARSRGLRLLVACQHLDQLSGDLRTALLANTAVRTFFRLGYADAQLAAASLSAGTGEKVLRIAADVAKRDTEGYPEAWAEMAHTIRDGRGEPVCLSPAAAQAFWHLARKADGAAQVAGLKRLARVSGIDRLYVHAADTKQPVELSRYLKGLAAEDYYLSGTGPMRLVVSFPRPRLAVLSRETEAERSQRWVKTLTELPVQRAVVRLSSGQTGEVQVMNVADPTAPAGFERFLSAAVAGSGQSAREVEQAQAWRREEVERVAGESKLAEQPVSHQEGQHGTSGPPGKSVASATYSSAANSFTTQVPKPLNHNEQENNQARRGGSQRNDARRNNVQRNAMQDKERKKQLSESDQTSPALAVPTAYEPLIAEDGSLA